ncbi:VOC family protein [Paraliomyxa miuraensis]|uniref:VOC family protein n=1 Tax=Paraliomyxa miuraensis TaxID=376150 RepID=UPI00225BD35D|nr:VOC family protein [Paraliomyxa miuraensis]MCX4244756.1 VOC family protein [Paraliomyxa miuraensis]
MSKFVHMELSTSDPEAATQFYESVFGWKSQNMTMADGHVYTMVMTAGGDGIGGIQKNPMPEAPSAWLGYVGVESVEATIAKVEELGGKVIQPKLEVAGMGWLAIFTDPQGATFAVWEQAMTEAAPEAAPAPAAPTEAKAAKKAAAKKAPAKKAPAKKAAAKKAPAKKAPAKKAAAKKAPAKKAPSKKAAAKKAPSKKAAKKTSGKKAAKKTSGKKPSKKK